MLPEFTVDRRFSSRVEKSARVMECAEAFGIGLEDREFVIYDNCKVDLREGDICYVTGQSGSGKSLMLKELKRQILDAGIEVADVDEIKFDAAKPLIDQVGADMGDAARLLSQAGLNDAYLFVRSPDQLSDGQGYRFRLAKLMESTARVWVADEFTATLDRTTARVVAFCLQKAARKVGATVIVATTHEDLVDDLKPNLLIRKRFKAQLEIDRPDD